MTEEQELLLTQHFTLPEKYTSRLRDAWRRSQSCNIAVVDYDDCLQAARVALLLAVKTFKPGAASFEPWFFEQWRGEFKSLMRKNKDHDISIDIMADILLDGASLEEEVIDHLTLFESLPTERLKDILVLLGEGYNQSDVSEKLGVSLPTIKRGVAKIKEALADRAFRLGYIT